MPKAKSYTVHFRTDIDCAETTIAAPSPQHALAKARAIAADEDQRAGLFFQRYTGSFPVNEIIIESQDGEELAAWSDQDLLLRLTARELLTALEAAVKALNTAKRFDVPSLGCDSYEVASQCTAAIAKAKGPGNQEPVHIPYGRSSQSPRGKNTTNSRSSNGKRAEWAAYALDEYGIRKEGCACYAAPESMAADLIADLLHLIRAHGYDDPILKLEAARMHFEAEEAGES